MSPFFICRRFMRFRPSCARRRAFALKWFCPLPRITILPLLVTLSRLVNDLFVFIKVTDTNLRIPTNVTIRDSYSQVLADWHELVIIGIC